MPSYKGSESTSIKLDGRFDTVNENSISLKRAHRVLHSTVTASATPVNGSLEVRHSKLEHLQVLNALFLLASAFPSWSRGRIQGKCLKLLRHLAQSDHTD